MLLASPIFSINLFSTNYWYSFSLFAFKLYAFLSFTTLLVYSISLLFKQALSIFELMSSCSNCFSSSFPFLIWWSFCFKSSTLSFASLETL